MEGYKVSQTLFVPPSTAPPPRVRNHSKPGPLCLAPLMILLPGVRDTAEAQTFAF